MSRYETDEDQVEVIKQWWQKNGTQLLSGILVVLLAWSGWTYWQNTKLNEGLKASAMFEMLQIRQQQGTFGEAMREGLTLMEEHPDSPYSTGIALMVAKHYFEKGELGLAIENYQWVLKHAPDASLKLVAQLRLATIYSDQQRFEEAQQLLSSIDEQPLAASEKANLAFYRAELAFNQGDLAAAKAGYQSVLDNNAAVDAIQNMASIKLADLAE